MESNRDRIGLIVTADDFGAGVGRNAGIVAAWRDGIVTAVSLLATGSAFDDAVALARRHAIPVGVHLDLADGRPLCGPIPGLTQCDGTFPGKARSREVLSAGDLDAAALRRELAAQIARVRAAGLHPTHLDSHQHAFLFPAVTAAVVEVALASGIRRLRLPQPVEPAEQDPPGPLGAELALYRRLAPAAAAALRNAGLDSPDGLLGMPLLDRLDAAHLLALLQTLGPGTWELMTHPGRLDPGDPFGGAAAREIELAALTSSEVKSAVARSGIALLPFAAAEIPR